MNGQTVEQERIGTLHPALAACYWETLQTAEDLGRVIEEDLVRDLRVEHRPVHLASGFDHQGEIPMLSEIVEEFEGIGAATRPVTDKNLNARRFQSLATLEWSDGRPNHKDVMFRAHD